MASGERSWRGTCFLGAEPAPRPVREAGSVWFGLRDFHGFVRCRVKRHPDRRSSSATTIGAFTTTDIAALTATQVGAFTAFQIPEFTTTELSALSPRQMSGLTTTEINALGSNQMGFSAGAAVGPAGRAGRRFRRRRDRGDVRRSRSKA